MTLHGQLVGALVAGKYRIESVLGYGGMGSVYLAVQEPLGRKVALKVVRGADIKGEAHSRFAREARVVAQLNCPHVVTLFDFGDHEGEPYIAMELLDGETLKSRMGRGPVPLGDALSWTRDVACALRSAHDAGIVHRDVKPENVVIVRDRDRGTCAKLLDFGVAKLRGRADVAHTGTQLGTIVGTPGYIAPETVNLGRGDDPSVDVYALGVVLFEMLAARPPFIAETAMGVVVAHAHAPVPDLAPPGGAFPEEVVTLVRRLLAKSPDERPADGAALVAELDVVRVALGAAALPSGASMVGTPIPGVATPGPRSAVSPMATTAEPLPLPERPSIAVQPFGALGSEDERLFAEGISEDVLMALSAFKQLFVIATSSMLQPAGRDSDALRVARTVGVRYVLQGTVRRGGDRLRISAKLTDSTTGAQVWAQRYDRDLSDLFAVQDEVTQAIVATVVGRVEEAHADLAKKKAPHTLAAYDWLARGRALHHRRTKEDNERAREALDKAIELDPEYAQGHAWRACVWGQAIGMGVDVATAWKMAGKSLERALELDEGDAECQRLAAEVAIYSDMQKAWAHHLRAIELNPNDARIVAQKGEISIYKGDLETAVRALEQAIRLDPLSPKPFLRHLACARYLQGELGKAHGALDRLEDPGPDMLALRCAALALADDPKGLARALERARAANDGALPAIPKKPFVTAELGERWREGFVRAGFA